MRFSNGGEPVYGDRFLEFWSGKDVGLQIRAKAEPDEDPPCFAELRFMDAAGGFLKRRQLKV
jgi:hypothetical protein